MVLQKCVLVITATISVFVRPEIFMPPVQHKTVITQHKRT